MACCRIINNGVWSPVVSLEDVGHRVVSGKGATSAGARHVARESATGDVLVPEPLLLPVLYTTASITQARANFNPSRGEIRQCMHSMHDRQGGGGCGETDVARLLHRESGRERSIKPAGLSDPARGKSIVSLLFFPEP